MPLTDRQIKNRDKRLQNLSITTYEEKKGYVFVSYKSDNWKVVFEKKIFELQEHGLRIYSDKDFDNTNSCWLEDMEINIKHASAFLMFISPEYLKSSATLIELLTAIEQEKEIIPIYFKNKNDLFKELLNVDLEKERVKIGISEELELKRLMKSVNSRCSQIMEKHWNEGLWEKYIDKISSKKFYTVNIVEIFKKLLFESGFKDNLFDKNINSLIETIKDASKNAEYPEVFEITSKNNSQDDKITFSEAQTTLKKEILLENLEKKIAPANDLPTKQQNFWKSFINYCEQINRKEEIASQNPYKANWYKVPLGTSNLHIEFTITSGNCLSILIYTDKEDTFPRLQTKREEIETIFGKELEWNLSKEGSKLKRIIYKKPERVDIFNPDKQEELFAWMVEQFDAMKRALSSVGEIG